MNRRTFIKGITATGFGLVAGDLCIPFAEAVDIQAFNFVHISDLHLDIRGDSNWQYREKSVPLFIDALRQMPRLPKLSFVVFGGDQIHYGPNDRESLSVFQQWTDNLNMPYYILLGNTEVSPVSGVSKLTREDYLNMWQKQGLRLGHSSWAIDAVRGVTIIGFDVTVDGKPHGLASRNGLMWLENELTKNKSKKLIIIFTHQLLMPTTARDTSPDWSFWMVKNHEEVRAFLKGFPNVRLVVSGHHHTSRVITEGRITYVADPAIVTYPCALRFFGVTQQGIHVKNVGLDDQVVVKRAKELLATDAYAKMYDPVDPQKVLDYSAGLSSDDRETRLRF